MTTAYSSPPDDLLASLGPALDVRVVQEHESEIEGGSREDNPNEVLR